MTTQKTSKKKTVIVVSVIVILVAIIGVLVYLLFKPKEPDEIPKVVTEQNKDTIMKDLEQKVADGMFEMKMTIDWSFENSTVPSSDAYVANATSNSNAFYFTVTLDDTDEEVFTSPEIPVGSEIKDVKLDKQIAAGQYRATLRYHLLDEAGGEKSTLGVGITLNIKN